MPTKKKATGTKKVEEPINEPVPAISFTEDEVQRVAEFVNYAYRNVQVSSSLKDLAQEQKKLNMMFNQMHNHVTKIEQYILDFNVHMQPKQAPEKDS